MAPTAPSTKDLDGFWGKPTSTLDWCEENYVVSHYIAEFWNTVSNLGIIVPPIIAMIYFTRYKQIETRYYLACIGILLVGIGSWCFHMTLLFEMQLLDELPMIYASCVLVYNLFESNGKSHQHNTALVIAATLYAVVVTVIYVTIKDPIFHEVTYGILVILMIGKGIYCMRHQEHSKYLFYYGLALAVVAFSIWNIDNIFCDQLRTLRESLPFPVSLLTQGHMWWHLLTGIGTHVHIMFSLHLRASYLKCSPQIKHIAGVPYLALNGAEKKPLDGNRNHYH